ncbi:MAG: VCBS domain-containing protein [Desulfuromonadaceae bacterium]
MNNLNTTESSIQVVFIDANIAKADVLLAGIDPAFQVVGLNADSPALEQIAAALRELNGVAAIHLFSHGSQGQLNMAGGTLTAASLDEKNNAAALATIRASLAVSADVLIYGCNVADGTVGRIFVEALAQETGANVAASTTLTGAAAFGGNWVLDVHVGTIETAPLSAPGYPAVLVLPVFITADLTGAVTEMITPVGNLRDTGTLTFTDLDPTESHWVAGVAASGPALGTLTARVTTDTTGSGTGGVITWTYSVPASSVEYLAKDQTRVERFNFTLYDSDGNAVTRTVVVTITGTNDVPTVSTTAPEGFTEALDASAQTLVDSGTITFGDVDFNDDVTISSAPANDIAWSGGTIDGTLAAQLVAGFVADIDSALPGSIAWTYNAGPANLDFLAAGETITFSYTITAEDDFGGVSSIPVSFTITGTNDAPEIDVIVQTNLIEQTDTTPLSTAIAVHFDDLDLTDEHVITVTDADASGEIAGLTLSEADLIDLISVGTATRETGTEELNLTLDFVAASTAFDYLAAGEQLTLTYTLQVDDGNGGVTLQEFVVTITGTNDAPTVSATAPAGFTEAEDASAQTLVDSGTITFGDVDFTDDVTISSTPANDIAWSDGTIDASLAAQLVAGFNAEVDSALPGDIAWTYSSGPANLDFLAEGETITFSYTITATDDSDVSTSTDITFTITGTNDIPTVSATAPEGFTEELDASAQTLVDSGIVTFGDLDSNDDVTISSAANGDIAWSGGTIDASLAAQLEAGFTAAVDSADPGSIAWTYSAGPANLDFLAEGETITFSYTITAEDDFGGVSSIPVSFTITGTNDAPEIDVIVQTNLIEQTDTSPLSAAIVVTFDDLDLTDDHVITVTDADASGEIAGLTLSEADLIDLITVSTATREPGTEELNLTLDFVAASTAFDYLAADEQLTLTYTLQVDDGNGGVTPQEFVVTITGTNDAPTVSATAPAGFTEAEDASAQTLVDSGTITFGDVDFNDDVTISSAANGDIAWSDGTIDASLAAQLVAGFNAEVDSALPGDIAWTYSAGPANLDFLAEGETITFSYTITATDDSNVSTSTDITFTITGTNDIPTVSATAPEGFTEELDASAQTLVDSGIVTFGDLDSNDDVTISSAANGDIAWSGGTIDASLAAQLEAGFTAAVDSADPGSIAWTYSAGPANLDFLAEGETITFSYTITAEDDFGGVSSIPVSFTITGTNDAPEIDAIAQSNLTEQTDTTPLSTPIVVTFDDLDLTDEHVITVTDADASGEIAGLTLSEADLIDLISVGTATREPGTEELNLTLDFVAASTAFDYLAADEQLTLTYTLQVDDGNGGVTPQEFVVTITGTNDAPTVSATAPAGFTEAEDASAQTLVDSGTITFGDVDFTDDVTISSAPANDIVWSDGTIDATLAEQLVAGFNAEVDSAAPGDIAWTYSSGPANLDFLAEGETITFSYTITATDDSNVSTSTDITFTITGTNDIPTVSATAPEGFTEELDASAQTLVDSGIVTFGDLDSNDDVTISSAANGDIAWSGGTIDASLAAQLEAGFTAAVDSADPGSIAWTYSAGPANLDFLAEGETITFSYTITAEDDFGGVSSIPVSFTITGTNDDPTIDSDDAVTIGGVKEKADRAVGENTTIHTASGAIEFADVDVTDTHAVELSSIVLDEGGTEISPLGTFTIGAINSETKTFTWTYSVNDKELDFLAENQELTQIYSIEVEDNNGGFATQDIYITITGTNDAPSIRSIAPVTLDEPTDASTLNHPITVIFDDVDLADTHTCSVTVAGLVGNTDGLLLDDSQLQALISVGTAVRDSDSSIHLTLPLTFATAAPATGTPGPFDYLAEGESLEILYSLNVDDGTVTKLRDFSVIINGTNDDPTVTATQPVGFTEVTTPAAQALVDSGTISFNDFDFNDDVSISFDPSEVVWSGGPIDTGLAAQLIAGFSINGGVPVDSFAPGVVSWNYNVASANLDFLAANDTITFHYTIIAEDDFGGSSSTAVNFTITGTNNVITLTEGVDTYTATPYSDTIYALGGNDVITGGVGNDTIYGGDGNDTLYGMVGNDALYGEAGDDRIIGGAGNDIISGGDGIDTADYSTSTDGVTVVLLNTAAQLVSANSGSDTITGIENVIGSSLSGSNLYGNASANTFTGGVGNDILVGNGGNDTLIGGAGNDLINGGSGNDTMSGGDGDDTFSGLMTGDDYMDGGAGIDTLDYSSVTNSVTVTLAIQTQPVGGTAGNDTIIGIENVTGSTLYANYLYGNSVANSLTGGSGNDTLVGNGGNDTLFGGAGNDTINGGSGNDSLNGGDGIDTLNGGIGSDVLNGGAGNDIFLFNSALGATNIDTLSDFTSGQEVIQLSVSIFGALGAASSIIDVSESDKLIYNSTTGALSYDADGAGSGAAVQFAIIGSGSHPGALLDSDFQLV